MLAAVGSGSHPGGAQRTAATSVGGFVSDIVFDNLLSPIDFAFAPDGRIFVADKNGAVDIIKDGDLLPTPFITLPVNSYGDRGLQSVLLDPDFETNGLVYLYYTYENNPDDPQGPKTGRVIRVTADGDAAQPGSELVLMGTEVGDPAHPACQDLPSGADCLPADGSSHVGGGLRFAPDGALLLATGDAAFLGYVLAPELMSRPQDLDSLAGKLLRINPADGNALPDNPFFTGDPSANRSKVFSYGFRNPFRLAVDPTTGTTLIGDVGFNDWEEIDAAEPGANFGWPCYEGTAEQPTFNTFAACQSLYASGIPNTHPLYSYANPPGAAIMAGAFYHGSDYPAEFAGAFFFADWVRNTISFLPADPDTGRLLPDSAQQLFAGAGAPLDFEAGPDGDIYYLAWNGGWDGSGPYGQLRHIRFVQGDRPPVARASGSAQGGLAPLTVLFSSAGSFDPDDEPGGELSFAWDFGDGNTSEEANPIHTFTQIGTHHVQLTVTDEEGAMGSAAVSVIVGNRPPVGTITVPTTNSAYQGGQTIAFSGTGQDSEDGALSGSHLQWNVILHHCHLQTATCHTHPFLVNTGAGGSLITPLQGGDDLFFLELKLEVTDSAGLSNTASIEIGPDSDGDGLLDEDEILSTGTDYLNPDTDGDGCTDGQEMGASEFAGGRRDPLNPWDYFDPNRDGVVRIEDIVAVVEQYYIDQGNPNYTTATDRSGPIGPKPWNLGPPDGVQRIDDVVDEVNQYFHDCA